MFFFLLLLVYIFFSTALIINVYIIHIYYLLIVLSSKLSIFLGWGKNILTLLGMNFPPETPFEYVIVLVRDIKYIGEISGE